MLFSQKRFTQVATIVVAALCLIVLRLYFLQVLQGEAYRARSTSNFIQERPILHQRGLILDQNGIPLVDNRAAHDVYVTFAMLPTPEKTIRQLGALLSLAPKRLREWIKHMEKVGLEQKGAALAFHDFFSLKECLIAQEWINEEHIEGIKVRLLKSKQKCQIKIEPFSLPSQWLSFQRLAKLIDLKPDDLSLYVEQAQKKAEDLGPFRPVLFASDIGFDAYAKLEIALSLGGLAGVAIFDSIRRRYIYGSLAAHVFGYLNELSPEEMQNKEKTYRLGERVGRRGIEAMYEKILRGKNGAERFVVDAKGRRFQSDWEVELLGNNRLTPSVAGKNLVLALDLELQKTAEKAFAGKAGSVIALDPKTGFVLALASFPAYDPNLLMSRKNRYIFEQMAQDSLRPWTNKALQEHYAPGSTFKAITAVAGLENGVLTPTSMKKCTGMFHLGHAQWRCFKREGHGMVGITQALQASCDVFFYNVGTDLGSDLLAKTSRLLGFGRLTGIDLDSEIKGIIPDKLYYKKRLGYYAPGFVVNSSIGQGDVTVTPLQLAVAYSALVNGGIIFRPQLVREITDATGRIIEKRNPEEVAHLRENRVELDLVKEGLSHVMKPGGTAYGIGFRRDLPELAKWVRESGILIGGKTGTAQVIRMSKAIKHLEVSEVRYAERDHAWFVGFAPVDNPEIVVVAMTEHGGFGGTTSAPVVAAVIKTWFEKVRGKGRYLYLKEEENGNQTQYH